MNGLVTPPDTTDDFIVYNGILNPLYEEINTRIRQHPRIREDLLEEVEIQMQQAGILTEFLTVDHINAFYIGLYKDYDPYTIIMAIEYEHQKSDQYIQHCLDSRAPCRDRMVKRRKHQQKRSKRH